MRLRAARILVALSIGLAPVTAVADTTSAESEGPLVLTLDDLARVAAKETPGIPTRPPSADAAFQLSRDPAGPGPAAANGRFDSGAAGSAAGSGDRVAQSWREEYFRLKAMALKQAIARGEAVHFGDTPPAGAEPGQDADEALPAAAASGPSCVYDRNGELLHAPPGGGCRPNRRSARTGPSSGDERCIFGIRGEILHAPAGRDCQAD